MRSHAVEGIRLDLKVDTYPVSVNVAMPAGLVVNELLTNALKHAFVGRDGGTITLPSLVDVEQGRSAHSAPRPDNRHAAAGPG
jgi:two-component sensor histidine kinase